MKKYLSLYLSTGEKIALIVIVTWIIASVFVPLPAINSLGM
ncbi:hypothetical protein [Ferruginibacter sp.]